jgi:hypothetical protein
MYIIYLYQYIKVTGCLLVLSVSLVIFKAEANVACVLSSKLVVKAVPVHAMKAYR